jgi:hypothetical protein
MKVEFIISYDEKEQDARTFEVPRPFWATKEKFAEYITRYIKVDDDLRKISCCVLNATKEDCPEWYLECNGKLYF